MPKKQGIRILPTRRTGSHPSVMDHTTKKAADRVNNHREDGEEAIKRTSNVVPIDSGKNREGGQVTSDSKTSSEGEKARRNESE